MKFEMTKIAAAMVLTVVATGAQAAVVGPTDMQITGGTYGLGAFTSGISMPIPLFGTNDITDQYNLPGWDLNTYQPSGVLAPGAALSFTFGTGSADQMNAFFAPSAVAASGGGPAPVFNGLFIDGNVSSIDMNSFFTNWWGINMNEGNAAQVSNGMNPLVTNLTMSSCVVGVSCNWTMSWKSTNIGGATNGQVATWALSGTIAAVPEASTYGMMLSGLGLVGLAARRRRK